MHNRSNVSSTRASFTKLVGAMGTVAADLAGHDDRG